jgi:hypothetical protein
MANTICSTLKQFPAFSAATAIGSVLCTKEENFATKKMQSNSNPMAIFYIINLMITFFGFFLAFKCISKGGNAVGHLLGACCCGILYIAYALANSCL